jgi:hypothetical protein
VRSVVGRDREIEISSMIKDVAFSSTGLGAVEPDTACNCRRPVHPNLAHEGGSRRFRMGAVGERTMCGPRTTAPGEHRRARLKIVPCMGNHKWRSGAETGSLGLTQAAPGSSARLGAACAHARHQRCRARATSSTAFSTACDGKRGADDTSCNCRRHKVGA